MEDHRKHQVATAQAVEAIQIHSHASKQVPRRAQTAVPLPPRRLELEASSQYLHASYTHQGITFNQATRIARY